MGALLDLARYSDTLANLVGNVGDPGDVYPYPTVRDYVVGRSIRTAL